MPSAVAVASNPKPRVLSGGRSARRARPPHSAQLWARRGRHHHQLGLRRRIDRVSLAVVDAPSGPCEVLPLGSPAIVLYVAHDVVGVLAAIALPQLLLQRSRLTSVRRTRARRGNYAQSNGKSGRKGEAVHSEIAKVVCSSAREIRSSRICVPDHPGAKMSPRLRIYPVPLGLSRLNMCRPVRSLRCHRCPHPRRSQ